MVSGRVGVRGALEDGQKRLFLLAPEASVSLLDREFAGDLEDPTTHLAFQHVSFGTAPTAGLSGAFHVADVRRLVPLPGVEGVIGRDLLRQIGFQLDFTAHRVRFFPGGRVPDPAKADPSFRKIPLVEDDNGWKVHAELDGEKADFYLGLVETRSGISSTLAERLHPVRTVSSHGIELGDSGKELRLRRLKVGELEWTDPVMAVSARHAGQPAEIHLGTDFFGRFRCLLDVPGGALYLQPDPGYMPSPRDASGIGVLIYHGSGGKPVVLVLIEPSPAAKVGIKAGDEVLTVNGTAADAMTDRDLDLVCRSAPGTPVTLKTRSVGGEERERHLVSEKLL
jgi:hypothetical protein